MLEVDTVVRLTEAHTCPVDRYTSAVFPDLMPISVKELPKILLKLFGIEITPRQAVSYGTERKYGFAECPATGKLSTTVPRIKESLLPRVDGAEKKPESEAGRLTEAAPRRRRGRPRGSKRVSHH